MKFKLQRLWPRQKQKITDPPGSESLFMLVLIQFLLSWNQFDKPRSLLNTVKCQNNNQGTDDS